MVFADICSYEANMSGCGFNVADRRIQMSFIATVDLKT